MKSVYNVLLLQLLICIFPVITCELELHDECELPSGKNGTCVYAKDCATALELSEGRSRPRVCKNDGDTPIICCEIRNDLKSALPFGAISQQKCNETWWPLAPWAYRYNYSRWVDLNGNPYNFGYGGVGASPKEFTHMAALGYGKYPNVSWSCGGTLISNKFVLTAAHCIDSLTEGRVKIVRLGDLNLRITTDIAEPQDFEIVRIIIHPAFKPPSFYNDIALLELDGEANYTDFVRPACLETKFDVNSNWDIWAALGWGITSYEGYKADHLQLMYMYKFPHDKCRKIYEDTSNRRLKDGINETSQVCAYDTLVDTCQGDSGGPLHTRNYAFIKGYTVVGITSFGKPCGLVHAPGIYTRVSNYIDWIESIVWPEEYFK